jgi:hypothetical protein
VSTVETDAARVTGHYFAQMFGVAAAEVQNSTTTRWS